MKGGTATHTKFRPTPRSTTSGRHLWSIATLSTACTITICWKNIGVCSKSGVRGKSNIYIKTYTFLKLWVNYLFSLVLWAFVLQLTSEHMSGHRGTFPSHRHRFGEDNVNHYVKAYTFTWSPSDWSLVFICNTPSHRMGRTNRICGWCHFLFTDVHR